MLDLIRWIIDVLIQWNRTSPYLFATAVVLLMWTEHALLALLYKGIYILIRKLRGKKPRVERYA